MTDPTGDALKASAAQVTKGKIELWFFRDMLDQNRLALFSLFGIKAESVQTLGGQKLALHSVLSALSPVEQAPQPVAVEAASEPVVYVSSKQLPHNPEHAYIACRLQSEGNFDTPLYATPTEAPPVESLAVRLKALEEIHQRWLDGYSFNEDSDEDVQLRDLADATLAAEGSAE